MEQRGRVGPRNEDFEEGEHRVEQVPGGLM